MLEYRIYFVKEDGQLAAAPAIIRCVDDQDVIKRATFLSHLNGLEIWEADRLVLRSPVGSSAQINS